MPPRRRDASQRSSKHLRKTAWRFDHRHPLDAVERWFHMAMRVRERDPQLRAIQAAAVSSRCLLGVSDAASRRHDVDAARAGRGYASQAVIVEHLAFEQPRHGLETGVRVRRDVHRFLGTERQRSETIEEAPRADHAPVTDGEHRVTVK
jgi:hypothetical protein